MPQSRVFEDLDLCKHELLSNQPSLTRDMSSYYYYYHGLSVALAAQVSGF